MWVIRKRIISLSRSAPLVKPIHSTGSPRTAHPILKLPIRFSSTGAATSSPIKEEISPPTTDQLKKLFLRSTIPMIGFGFTDQTVMIQAGNAIDCTLGVTFGLSTLTAAAFGQICSDASGVLFGGTLERLAEQAGLPKTGLTTAQRALPIVKRTRLFGNFVGILVGCVLGLVNLLFIDTERSSTLKLNAFHEEQEFEFHVTASNAVRPDATALTVQGPDVDGLLASMTAALAVRGCSLVELHANSQKKRHPSEMPQETQKTDSKESAEANMVHDVFFIVNRETGLPFEDDELEELARGLLNSTRTPMNVNSVKAAMHELEQTNSYLEARLRKLEEVMYQKQITVIKANDPESSEIK